MDDTRDDDGAIPWEARLQEPPDIDIDTWTLLWEARIVQGAWQQPKGGRG